MARRHMQRGCLGLARLVGTTVLVAALQGCATSSPTAKPGRVGERGPTRAQAASGVVVGSSGLYRVSPPGEKWKRVEAGTHGEDSDLELENADAGSIMVGYVHKGANLSIDDVVRSRLSILEGSFDVDRLQESRFFLEGSDHRPASLRLYALSTGKGERFAMFVLTVNAERAIIEAMSRPGGGKPAADAALDLLSSLRLEPDS